MPEITGQVSDKAKAVLFEIAGALERLAQTGESHTIFIDKMGLDQEDRQAIRECLGLGGLRINFDNSAEPAEWLESEISGVWYGVFYDQSRAKPLLETVEVTSFPQVAAAQPEDIGQGAAILRERLETLD